jgi:membrane protein
LFDSVKKLYNFFDDDTLYYSASLSFFTIFSLLPILALIIAIMSSYPIFSDQIDILMIYVLDFVNPTHSAQVSNSITHFLANIDKLGSLGMFYLIFVFIMFFKDYEYIVSMIHNSQKRTFINMLFLYTALLFLIPIILVSFTFLSIILIDNDIGQILLNFFFGLLFITVLFKLSVNKFVSLKAASISAFVTIISLKITQNLFLYYILYNTTYSTIYGTLSVLLIMFLWIYISWTIYLYGVKFCHKLNMRYQS